MIVEGVALGFVLPIVLPGTLPRAFRFRNDFCDPIKSTKEGWDCPAEIDQHVLVHHRFAVMAMRIGAVVELSYRLWGTKRSGLKVQRGRRVQGVLLTRGMDMN